jgi:hypothetical protein
MGKNGGWPSLKILNPGNMKSFLSDRVLKHGMGKIFLQEFEIFTQCPEKILPTSSWEKGVRMKMLVGKKAVGKSWGIKMEKKSMITPKKLVGMNLVGEKGL